MARRRQSGAEEVIEIVAVFPWYVGILLALISYIGLHIYAGQGLAVTNGHNISESVKSGLLHAFASLGQYILPMLFTLGSLVSLIKRTQRKNLHTEVSQGDRLLKDISWQEFELLIGEHFRQNGFKVTETGSGADGGIDLVLKKEGQKYLVQCKHWKAYKVGVKPVRELLGVMASNGASGGYFVASGEYTADAVRFGKANKIELIDGKALEQILSNRIKEPSVKIDKPSSVDERICPKCGSKMVLRTAKKGKKTGEQFWGCSEFPKCRSTVSYG